MCAKLTSTVAFKSNLQIVSGTSIKEDRNFLAFINDPFALEYLNNNRMSLTPAQQSAFDKASLHCAYAAEGDYPYGTIIDSEGIERNVCRCVNTACGRFKKCRPDFDPSELETAERNVIYRGKNADIDLTVAPAKNAGDGNRAGDEQSAGRLRTGADGKNNLEAEEPGLADALTEEDERKGGRTEGPAEKDSVRDRENASGTAKGGTLHASEVSFASFETVGQEDIIELGSAERTVVNAGPGTGKTWTVIEKIKHMLNETGTEPESILVLCYSRAAVEVIRSRLESAAAEGELPINWHQADVRSFDSFATYLLAWHLENKPELLPDDYVLEVQSYDERIYRATEVLRKAEGILDSYGHVIVDEVQDLVGVRAEMVLALLEILPDTCGFTLLGDSCQALYDYLAEKDCSIMPSERFYETLFRKFPQANYCSLDRNFRQGDRLGKTTLPYREAILTGTPNDRSEAAALLDSMISTSDADLKRFTADTEKKYTKTGTLGILTRTNGQALQISSWLRAEGIRHNLLRPLNSSQLGAWIADVFSETETDVTDFFEFEEIFERLYPQADARRFWDAILSTQTERTRRHYEIEDLLRGLSRNARDPLLFDEPCNERALITVSTVHRSKGREYDTVLVTEDVVKDMNDGKQKDLLEHKVCYVALTRPKKKIEKIKPGDKGDKYIYTAKDDGRRCFRRGGYPYKKYLSHYEVGFDTDFDNRSFARSKENQSFLRESVGRGAGLNLLKCPRENEGYTLYRIVPEDNTDIVLGYTGRGFACGMERAIQRIFKSQYPVNHKHFPRIFGEIYADGLTSCISADGADIPGAIKFGNMFLWYGIRISGFAQSQ